MTRLGLSSPQRVCAVGVVVVVVAAVFFESLFAGGSMLSVDLIEQLSPPFNADRPAGFVAENGPGDPINVHAHWGTASARVREGEFSWWMSSVGGGHPVMKAGAPVFDLPYLFLPQWYAPGFVAAIRTLVAALSMIGFLRALRLRWAPCVIGGLGFALSGFMVGWMNWPHSSVAALAPGLLWTLERLVVQPRLSRAVPVAVIAAATVWSNFPQVALYVGLGAFVYVAGRTVTELSVAPGGSRVRHVARTTAAGAFAAVLMLGLAGPHLWGFRQYLEWADTSHRVGSGDSAAGPEYLLTLGAPAVFGSDASGPRWWAEGNWVEFNTYVGASVVLLAAFSLARRVDDCTLRGARRRSGAVSLAVIGVLGVVMAYIGGPLGRALTTSVIDGAGLATRAKVLIALAVAALAALGADAWLDGVESSRARRSLVSVGAASGLVALAVVGPSVIEWYRDMQGLGVARQTARASVVPLAAATVVSGSMLARWRSRVPASWLGWLWVGVVAIELALFTSSVPTTVGRGERLGPTSAHEQVRDLLSPGERLGGEGNTFFPNTGAIFGIDDMRGQLLKSPGYQALLRSVDERVFDPGSGGTPTYPNIQVGTDASMPLWDSFAVGAWAQFPSSLPPGPYAAAGQVVSSADPAIAALRGSLVVPEGGLRAVVLEVVAASGSEGFVEVSVAVDGEMVASARRRDELVDGPTVFALAGEHLRAGSLATVTVDTDGLPGIVGVGLTANGEVAVGTVAGQDDGLRLVRAGDVTLLERTTSTYLRLGGVAHVEPDPYLAAQLVRARSRGDGLVVDRAVEVSGEPVVASADMVEVRDGRVSFTVDAEAAVVAVLAENAYPGWTARVGDRQVDVITVDSTFVGVVVPAGRHEVVMQFRPTHLGASVLSMSASLVTILAIWVMAVRRRVELAR